MAEIRIGRDRYKINSIQEKQFQELLKGHEKTTLVEFKSFDIVDIVVGGIVYDLGKATFNNYKQMIADILNNTPPKE